MTFAAHVENGHHDSGGAPERPGAANPPRRRVVVIASRIPAYAAGLSAVLEAEGYETVRRAEPETWLGRRGRADAALAPVASAAELARLVALADGAPDLVLVALLVSPRPEDYVSALQRGAHAAVDWGADPADIVRALEAALAGHTVLPTPVVRSLALASPAPLPAAALSAEDVRWLRLLAMGCTVAQLADGEGYSQREVFRRLARIYKRMGAGSRPEAIALAAQWGLLGHSVGQDSVGQDSVGHNSGGPGALAEAAGAGAGAGAGKPQLVGASWGEPAA